MTVLQISAFLCNPLVQFRHFYNPSDIQTLSLILSPCKVLELRSVVGALWLLRPDRCRGCSRKREGNPSAPPLPQKEMTGQWFLTANLFVYRHIRCETTKRCKMHECKCSLHVLCACMYRRVRTHTLYMK